MENESKGFDFTISKDSAIKTYYKSAKKKAESIKDLRKLPHNLSVYKACIDLINLIINSTSEIPGWLKAIMFSNVIQLLISIELDICNAASSTDKIENLRKAIKLTKEVLFFIRILYDTRKITDSKFAILSSRSEDLSRQLNGWYNSEVSKQNQA